MQITPASGINRVKAKPGLGCVLDETKLDRIPAPAKARIIASTTATRRKLRSIRARIGRVFVGSYVSEEKPLATSSRKYWNRARTVTNRPIEAAMIHSTESDSITSNAASTARFRLPRRMWVRARTTNAGCRVDRRAESAVVTGSVSRYSMKQKRNKAAAVAPSVQRHAISANVSDGRRNAARKPSIVGDGADIPRFSLIRIAHVVKVQAFARYRRKRTVPSQNYESICTSSHDICNRP